MKLKQYRAKPEVKPIVNSIRRFDSYASGIDTHFHNVIRMLFEAASEKANKQIGSNDDEKYSKMVQADGGYKCIHLPVEEFIRLVSAMLEQQGITEEKMKVKPLKFIDIGCGVGQKVYLAKVFGFQSYGLELRPELIAEGKRLFSDLGQLTELSQYDVRGRYYPDDVFIQGNALTFPDFAKFDVLYFYCPLFDRKLQADMELHLAKTSKVGAVVIPRLTHGVFSSVDWASELGWHAGGEPDRRYFVKTDNTWDI